MIKVSSGTFKRLLDAAPDAEIAEAGQEAGTDTPKAIIVAKQGNLSLTTVIDYLKTLSEYANAFEYNEVESEGKRIVSLIHGLGSKGSIFFPSYAKALFESVGADPKISSSEHSVVVEL